ncbi:MAG: helix-turn-helix domain-containing protein [Candidatus Bathyarchaeia archaeon]
MNKSEIYEHANKVLLLLKFSKGAKSRKIILKSLCLKPKNCNQIAKESKLEWWTVQKHLEVLMKENLIISVRFGRIKFYKITPKGEKALTEIFSSQKPTSQS